MRLTFVLVPSPPLPPGARQEHARAFLHGWDLQDIPLPGLRPGLCHRLLAFLTSTFSSRLQPVSPSLQPPAGTQPSDGLDQQRPSAGMSWRNQSEPVLPCWRLDLSMASAPAPLPTTKPQTQDDRGRTLPWPAGISEPHIRKWGSHLGASPTFPSLHLE